MESENAKNLPGNRKLPYPDKRGYVRPEIGDKRFTIGHIERDSQGEMKRVETGFPSGPSWTGASFSADNSRLPIREI